MSTDPNTTATTEPVWGAAQPAAPQGQQGPRWTGRKTVIAVAVAVAIATAGGVAIYAATGSSSATSQTGGPGGMGQGGPGRGGGMMGGPGGGGLAGALHGTFTVSSGNGTYTEELMQTGTVTAVSANSITAKSTDGYTKTYTIDSSTKVDNGNSQLSAIATGNTVTIIAKGDAVTSISERPTN